jgi:hypothetical protein
VGVAAPLGSGTAAKRTLAYGGCKELYRAVPSAISSLDRATGRRAEHWEYCGLHPREGQAHLNDSYVLLQHVN